MDKITNFDALKNLIRNTKYEWADGVFSIGPHGSRISVDTVNNTVFKQDMGSWKEVALGTKKSNGYLYTPINLEGQDCVIGIHTIVCMLVNGLPDDYMIANHKDNCPWNNAPANLEWVSQGQNNLHGRVVKSLNKHFPDGYTHLEKRGNGVHIILDIPLSVHDIEKYLTFKPAGYFSVKKVEGYIDKNKLLDFIKWLGW